MEISSRLPAPEMDQPAVDRAGFVAYLSACGRSCSGLAAWLLVVMTLADIAVLLTMVAVIFLALRSAGLWILASRPALNIPWFDHLTDRAK